MKNSITCATRIVNSEHDGVRNKKAVYPSGFVLTLVPDEIDRTEKIMNKLV